jgi:hypothetical protein
MDSGSAIVWTTVEVFAHRHMAEVAGSALRGAGLRYRVMADDAGGTEGLQLGSGAQLQVPGDQREVALALLAAEPGTADGGHLEDLDAGRAVPTGDRTWRTATDLPGWSGAMRTATVAVILLVIAVIAIAELL